MCVFWNWYECVAIATATGISTIISFRRESYLSACLLSEALLEGGLSRPLLDLHYAILCYTMLCYAILCYAMLCYNLLYYTVLMLCHAMPCHAMPCHAMPYRTTPYHTIWIAVLLGSDAIAFCEQGARANNTLLQRSASVGESCLKHL